MSDTLSVVRVRVPFSAPFSSAARTWTARDAWLLRSTAADGTSRWGEAVLDDEEDVAVLEALLESLEQTGLPPAPALLRRAGAAGRALMGALEQLDLDSTSLEASMAAGEGIGVNATIGARPPDEVAALVAARVAHGFRTLKLKAAAEESVGDLVARVMAARVAAGDEVDLRLDVNGAWTLEDATLRLRSLAGFRLAYVEQPLPADDLGGMAALRAMVGVPIAADEAVASVDDARAVLAAGAADVLVVKPARVGGVAATVQIARLAAAANVPVVVTSAFETGIGLRAAIAAAAAVDAMPERIGPAQDHGLATLDLLDDDLLTGPITVVAGRLRAAAGAMAVDEAAIERYRMPVA